MQFAQGRFVAVRESLGGQGCFERRIGVRVQWCDIFGGDITRPGVIAADIGDQIPVQITATFCRPNIDPVSCIQVVQNGMGG